MFYIQDGMKVRNNNAKLVKEVIAHNEKYAASVRKPYKATKWAREMVKAIKRDNLKKGGYKPSGSFLAELEKKGALNKAQPKNLPTDYTKGGIY